MTVITTTANNHNDIKDGGEKNIKSIKNRVEPLIAYLSRFGYLAATGQLSVNTVGVHSLPTAADEHRRYSGYSARMAAIKHSFLRRFSSQSTATDQQRRDSDSSRTTTLGSRHSSVTALRERVISDHYQPQPQQQQQQQESPADELIYQEFYQHLLISSAERVANLLQAIATQLKLPNLTTGNPIPWSQRRVIIDNCLDELVPALFSLVWFVPHAAAGLRPLGARLQEDLVMTAQHLVCAVNEVLDYLPLIITACINNTITTGANTTSNTNNTVTAANYSGYQLKAGVALNSDRLDMPDPLAKLAADSTGRKHQQRGAAGIVGAGEAHYRRADGEFQVKLRSVIQVFMLFLDHIQQSEAKMMDVPAIQRQEHGSLLDLSRDPAEDFQHATVGLKKSASTMKKRLKSSTAAVITTNPVDTNSDGRIRRLSDVVYPPVFNSHRPSTVFALWNASPTTVSHREQPSAPPQKLLSSLNNQHSSPPSYDRVLNKIDLLNSLIPPTSNPYRLVDSGDSSQLVSQHQQIQQQLPLIMRGIVRIAQVKRREQKFWWWSRSKVNNSTGNNRAGKWKDYEVEVYASQIMIAKRIISNGNSGSGSGKHSIVWNLNECRMEKSNTDNLQLLQITCNAGGNRTYTILMDFHGSIRQWLPHFGLS